MSQGVLEPGFSQSIVSSYFYTGQPSGPSDCVPNPHQNAVYDPQDDRPQRTGFDRFHDLVDVCWKEVYASTDSSTFETPLSPHVPPFQDPIPDPYNPLCILMRTSDPERDPQDDLSSLDHNDSLTLSRERKRHPCKMCHKTFDRSSTLKTVSISHASLRFNSDILLSHSISSYTLA